MPIFGAIREDALQLLVELSRSVTVAANEFFFREGDQATGLYVLEAGKVAVLKSWKGKQFLLRYLGEGDCFGEMALMDLFPRSASLRAMENCQAIELTSDHLYRLFERDAEQFALIQMNIGREVCRRLRATDELLFQAEMGSLPEASEALFRST